MYLTVGVVFVIILVLASPVIWVAWWLWGVAVRRFEREWEGRA